MYKSLFKSYFIKKKKKKIGNSLSDDLQRFVNLELEVIFRLFQISVPWRFTVWHAS